MSTKKRGAAGIVGLGAALQTIRGDMTRLDDVLRYTPEIDVQGESIGVDPETMRGRPGLSELPPELTRDVLHEGAEEEVKRKGSNKVDKQQPMASPSAGKGERRVYMTHV